MMKGAPGATLDKAPGKFRNRESAARYFRKIKSGERTGGAMYQAGVQKQVIGNWQFRVKLGPDRYIGQNILAAGVRSTFDIPTVEHELLGPRRADVQAIISRFRERYGMEAAQFSDEDFDVRPIKRSKTLARMRLHGLSAPS